MPEVIEVMQYVQTIQKIVDGDCLEGIRILSGRYKTHGPFAHFDILKRSMPLCITHVGSKGKFMYFQFDNGYSLGFTLGLTGGWFYETSKSKSIKHGLPKGERYRESEESNSYIERARKAIRIHFQFSKCSLYFSDLLSYGTITLFLTPAELQKKLDSLGVDIMDPRTTFSMFYEQVKKSTNLDKPIGNVLVNQRYIAGIGNYLRSDALWAAGISPFRTVKSLTRKQLEELFKQLRVLTWGYVNFKKAVKLGLIEAGSKLPSDYGRDFYVYMQDTDIHGRPVLKEELYEGSQKRFVYWVKS